MLTLVAATYALSMVVTNAVGLIIMVPFTITVLSSINRNDKLIKVVVLETLAANLGGMATPIGNPHNLFKNRIKKQFTTVLHCYILFIRGETHEFNNK